jgi:hypothetical protein
MRSARPNRNIISERSRSGGRTSGSTTLSLKSRSLPKPCNCLQTSFFEISIGPPAIYLKSTVNVFVPADTLNSRSLSRRERIYLHRHMSHDLSKKSVHRFANSKGLCMCAE